MYRHMAFLGQESVWAAEASECAGEQGQFWPYHDLLFQYQSGRNSGTFSQPNLKRMAGELGLDRARFDSCVDSGRYANLVRSETEAGRAKGVNSTPTVFVNGRKVEGFPEFEQLKLLISQAARG